MAPRKEETAKKIVFKPPEKPLFPMASQDRFCLRV
jgi:hypothetical protein